MSLDNPNRFHGFSPAESRKPEPLVRDGEFVQPEHGLQFVTEQILAGCQAGTESPEQVLEYLMSDAQWPEALVKLLKQRISPLLFEMQRQLQVAETVPVARALLLADARMKITEFLKQQHELLRAYQGLASLSIDKSLEVAHISLEECRAIDQVPNAKLSELTLRSAELKRGIDEKVLAEAVRRVRDFIEQHITSLPHRESFAVNVRNITREFENGRTFYRLELAFEATQSLPMESAGSGTHRDMLAIERPLKREFPGIAINWDGVGNKRLTVQLERT